MESVELVLESVGNDYPGLVREALVGSFHLKYSYYLARRMFFIICNA